MVIQLKKLTIVNEITISVSVRMSDDVVVTTKLFELSELYYIDIKSFLRSSQSDTF